MFKNILCPNLILSLEGFLIVEIPRPKCLRNNGMATLPSFLLQACECPKPSHTTKHTENQVGMQVSEAVVRHAPMLPCSTCNQVTMMHFLVIGKTVLQIPFH